MSLRQYVYLERVEISYEGKIEYPKEMGEIQERMKREGILEKVEKYRAGSWRDFYAAHIYIVGKYCGELMDEEEIYLAKEFVEEMVGDFKEKGKNEGASEEYLREVRETVETLESVLEFVKRNPEYEIKYLGIFYG